MPQLLAPHIHTSEIPELAKLPVGKIHLIAVTAVVGVISMLDRVSLLLSLSVGKTVQQGHF